MYIEYVCRYNVIPLPPASILQQRSHGMPSWCEQLLYSMLYDGLLEFVPESESIAEEMASPPFKYRVVKISFTSIQSMHVSMQFLPVSLY